MFMPWVWRGGVFVNLAWCRVSSIIGRSVISKNKNNYYNSIVATIFLNLTQCNCRVSASIIGRSVISKNKKNFV